jgi:ketosteroid isomerase-like protein
MTRLAPVLACFASTLMVAAPASSQAHEPTSKAAAHAATLSGPAAQAAAVVDAFHAALKAGDTGKAAGFLEDGVVVFEAGGAERSRADYAAGHLAADAAFTKTATETQLRRTGGASGEVAWIASEGRTTSATGAKAVDRLTTETMILRRSPKGWRIVHVHWSSRAAAAAH